MTELVGIEVDLSDLDPVVADIVRTRMTLGLETIVSAGVVIDSAGRRWDPRLHPRGRDGQFIETGGLLRLFLGERSNETIGAGRVESILPNGNVAVRITASPNHPELVDQVQEFKPHSVSTLREKAHLGKARNPLPPAAERQMPDKNGDMLTVGSRVRLGDGEEVEVRRIDFNRGRVLVERADGRVQTPYARNVEAVDAPGQPQARIDAPTEARREPLAEPGGQINGRNRPVAPGTPEDRVQRERDRLERAQRERAARRDREDEARARQAERARQVEREVGRPQRDDIAEAERIADEMRDRPVARVDAQPDDLGRQWADRPPRGWNPWERWNGRTGTWRTPNGDEFRMTRNSDGNYDVTVTTGSDRVIPNVAPSIESIEDVIAADQERRRALAQDHDWDSTDYYDRDVPDGWTWRGWGLNADGPSGDRQNPIPNGMDRGFDHYAGPNGEQAHIQRMPNRDSSLIRVGDRTVPEWSDVAAAPEPNEQDLSVTDRFGQPVPEGFEYSETVDNGIGGRDVYTNGGYSVHVRPRGGVGPGGEGPLYIVTSHNDGQPRTVGNHNTFEDAAAQVRGAREAGARAVEALRQENDRRGAARAAREALERRVADRIDHMGIAAPNTWVPRIDGVGNVVYSGQDGYSVRENDGGGFTLFRRDGVDVGEFETWNDVNREMEADRVTPGGRRARGLRGRLDIALRAQGHGVGAEVLEAIAAGDRNAIAEALENDPALPGLRQRLQEIENTDAPRPADRVRQIGLSWVVNAADVVDDLEEPLTPHDRARLNIPELRRDQVPPPPPPDFPDITPMESDPVPTPPPAVAPAGGLPDDWQGQVETLRDALPRRLADAGGNRDLRNARFALDDALSAPNEADRARFLDRAIFLLQRANDGPRVQQLRRAMGAPAAPNAPAPAPAAAPGAQQIRGDVLPDAFGNDLGVGVRVRSRRGDINGEITSVYPETGRVRIRTDNGQVYVRRANQLVSQGGARGAQPAPAAAPRRGRAPAGPVPPAPGAPNDLAPNPDPVSRAQEIDDMHQAGARAGYPLIAPVGEARRDIGDAMRAARNRDEDGFRNALTRALGHYDEGINGGQITRPDMLTDVRNRRAAAATLLREFNENRVQMGAAPPPPPPPPGADPINENATADDYAAWGSERAESIAESARNYVPLSYLFNDQTSRPDRLRAARSIFNGTFGGGGLQTSVTSVEGWGNQIGIQGKILDANGAEVGSFSRSITDMGNGQYSAYNAYLQVTGRVQGGGFARAFARRVEDWYIANGVEYVNVSANIDKGGFVWARTGFDYVPGRKAAGASTHLSAIERHARGNPEAMAQVQAMRGRIANPGPNEENVPTPFEMSQIGWTPGARTWPGKQGMLGTHWSGRKILKPDDRVYQQMVQAGNAPPLTFHRQPDPVPTPANTDVPTPDLGDVEMRDGFFGTAGDDVLWRAQNRSGTLTGEVRLDEDGDAEVEVDFGGEKLWLPARAISAPDNALPAAREADDVVPGIETGQELDPDRVDPEAIRDIVNEAEFEDDDAVEIINGRLDPRNNTDAASELWLWLEGDEPEEAYGEDNVRVMRDQLQHAIPDIEARARQYIGQTSAPSAAPGAPAAPRLTEADEIAGIRQANDIAPLEELSGQGLTVDQMWNNSVPGWSFRPVDNQGQRTTFIGTHEDTGRRFIVKTENQQGARSEISSTALAREMGLEAATAVRLGEDPNHVIGGRPAPLIGQTFVGEQDNIHDAETWGNVFGYGDVDPSELRLGDDRDLIRMGVFDAITDNADRHENNMMLGMDNEGRNHLLPIDHGYTFGSGAFNDNPHDRFTDSGIAYQPVMRRVMQNMGPQESWDFIQQFALRMRARAESMRDAGRMDSHDADFVIRRVDDFLDPDGRTAQYFSQNGAVILQ